MPLVTTKEMLKAALEGRFAVGAFNANNMEMVQAIVEAATEERAPVILQVSQGAIRYAGLAYAAGLVNCMIVFHDELEKSHLAGIKVIIPVVYHVIVISGKKTAVITDNFTPEFYQAFLPDSFVANQLVVY